MSKDKILEALFNSLGDELLERLKNKTASSADLNCARQWLRDNNITATTGRENPHMRNLVENLPYDENGDEARH